MARPDIAHSRFRFAQSSHPSRRRWCACQSPLWAYCRALPNPTFQLRSPRRSPAHTAKRWQYRLRLAEMSHQSAELDWPSSAQLARLAPCVLSGQGIQAGVVCCVQCRPALMTRFSTVRRSDPVVPGGELLAGGGGVLVSACPCRSPWFLIPPPCVVGVVWLMKLVWMMAQPPPEAQRRLSRSKWSASSPSPMPTGVLSLSLVDATTPP